MFRVFDHSRSVCYSARHSVYHLFCFLGLCCFLLFHHPTRAQNISATDSAESEKPYSNVYTKTSIKGRGFVPANTPKKPLVDITYWPLTTSIGIASAVLLVPVGIAAGFLLHVSDSKLNYLPTGAMGISTATAFIVGGTVGGLLLGSMADQIAHGTHSSEESLPMYPAYAASIGSGIFWGSMLGLSTLVVAPSIATGIFFLGSAPLGGYLASLLPVPQTTAQVGLRNLGGTMGAVTSASMFLPILQLTNQITQGSNPALSGGLAATTIGAMPLVGLFVGDLIGQTNIYTDTDVFWVGVGAATGAAIGGGLTYTLGRAIDKETANVYIATPIATNIGMYAGAGATLWGLASLHAAQAE